MIAHICARCAKPIKGKRVVFQNPILNIKLGIADRGEYHPACFKRQYPAVKVAS